MNLLLDTNIVLWLFNADERLSVETKRHIARGDTIVYVSAVTAWEIVIKRALGKLRAPDDFRESLLKYRFTELDITTEHALAVEELVDIHKDPFDRMLVAQARCEKLRLVTADKQIQRYDVALLMA